MPNVRNDNKIHFAIKPGWPMNVRIAWMLMLVGTGILIQLFVHVFVGWLFVLAGAVLGIVGGRDFRPRFSAAGEWQTTTIEELENIDRLSERTKNWNGRVGAYSIADGTGCGLFILAVVFMVLGGALIVTMLDGMARVSSLPAGWTVPPARGGLFLPIWVLDCIAMMVPLWFVGGMKAWQPDKLILKEGYLLNIYRTYKSDPALEFLPSLLAHKIGDRTVPSDCRLLVKLKDVPEDFIGIQVQVSMNKVQSSEYPYCYCVIIARKSFGLQTKAQPHLEAYDGGFLGLGKLFISDNDRKESVFSRFDDSIAEMDVEPDVDVIVVRQVTSGKGYTTTTSQALEVFRDALTLSRAITKG